MSAKTRRSHTLSRITGLLLAWCHAMSSALVCANPCRIPGGVDNCCALTAAKEGRLGADGALTGPLELAAVRSACPSAQPARLEWWTSSTQGKQPVKILRSCCARRLASLQIAHKSSQASAAHEALPHWDAIPCQCAKQRDSRSPANAGQHFAWSQWLAWLHTTPCLARLAKLEVPLPFTVRTLNHPDNALRWPSACLQASLSVWTI